MPTRIASQAAWRGDELFARADWQLRLDDAEVVELKAAVRQAQARFPAAEQVAVEHLAAADFPLPTLAPRLRQIQTDLEEGAGICLIRGIPVESFTADEAAVAFCGLAAHLGTAVPQTAAGERLFHVRDEGFAPNDPQSRGPSSRNRLSFHSDRCDVIAFLCLRQARRGGENFVVSAATLYNELLERRPDLVDVLMQPFYYQRHNVDPGNQFAFYQQPVFAIFQGHFAAQLLRVLIDRADQSGRVPPLSALQREALDALDALAEDPALHVQFRQQPGDLVLLNNLVTLHRRAEFEDDPDPKLKRHLLRLWLATPNSRPLDPRFAASYGETAAGAIRGGMRAQGGMTND